MFSQNSGYTKRYLEKHCREFQFHQATHMDAKFHPKYKDHIIVVGKNNVPEEIKSKKVKLVDHLIQLTEYDAVQDEEA